MESTGQIPGTATHSASAVDDRRAATVYGGLFVLFAVELFLLGSVLWSWIINRHSFPDQFGSGTDWIWGLIGVVAAGWGAFYLAKSRDAAGRRELDYARSLLAIAVTSGAILLGVLSLNIARVFVAGPIVMDVRSQFATPASGGSSLPTAAPSGEAANGKKWFLMTCVTCHGPTGDGVLNAAPSLRASDFLKTSDATAISSLIRLGRAATDPANKTGKVMPARGGNPFLDETKIADLAAFLKQLETQFAGTAEAGASGVSVDFTDLQSQLAGQAAPVIRKWTMDDFASFDVPSGEEPVTLGMQAFVKASCNKCHMASVGSQSLGPTLDQVVTKYKREDLLRHVIDPSSEINEKYLSDSFLLLDGRTITGLVVSETGEGIELLTDLLKSDEKTTVATDEIDDRVKSKLSPMPAGLADVLTRQEIEGLIAYVDAAGKQLGVAAVDVLNHWVVPDSVLETGPSVWATTTPVSADTWGKTVRAADSAGYQFSFSWLFVAATSVLALHFLWVTGTGTAVVLHRELQLSLHAQRLLSQQTVLFWGIGLVWLVIWFLIFFLWG